MAEQPSYGDLRDLYLILDGPRANALNDSGALGWLRPPRSLVAPVLYEVGDRERDVVTIVLQHHRERLARQRIVLHDQEPRLGVAVAARLSGRRAHRGSDPPMYESA